MFIPVIDELLKRQKLTASYPDLPTPHFSTNMENTATFLTRSSCVMILSYNMNNIYLATFPFQFYISRFREGHGESLYLP